MICLRRRKYEKIINHLIQEYHARHRREANQLIAEVLQDHISRGFANSTIVVTKMRSVEYDYIDKLVDFLFQSLEKDFPNFPLEDCKQILIKTVEVEYKKLRPTVNIWLVNARMAQQGILKQYEDGILKRLKETQKSIENRCELSSEKRGQKKWWHDPTNQWIVRIIIAILGIIVAALLTVIGWFFVRSYTKPESPNLGLYFAASKSKATEIGIIGPRGKNILTLKLPLTLENNGSRTFENVELLILKSKDVKIHVEGFSYDTNDIWINGALKSTTKINLNDLNPTKFGNPLKFTIQLTPTYTAKQGIDILDITSLAPPFVLSKITDEVKAFPFDGEIRAKDMVPYEIDLEISIGTREAFKAAGYKGEIFEINDNGELIKTAL
jgi:hypothetical protein